MRNFIVICLPKYTLLKLHHWQTIQSSVTNICSIIYENKQLHISAMPKPSSGHTAN